MIGKIPREGVIFDLAVLAANLWLVPRLSRLPGSGRGGEAAFGLLLLFSLPVYCLGTALKCGPLGSRLKGTKHHTGVLVALFFLLVMQYGLYIASLEFGWTLLGRETAGEGFMLLAISASALPPALTVLALLLPGKGSGAAAFREPLADLFLGFAAVVSLAWWNGVMVDALAGEGGRSPVLAIVMTILTAVPLGIFYLSPRILLLAEDYRRPATWARMAAVMLPLTARLMG